jgi:hypothetical protein
MACQVKGETKVRTNQTNYGADKLIIESEWLVIRLKGRLGVTETLQNCGKYFSLHRVNVKKLLKVPEK